MYLEIYSTFYVPLHTAEEPFTLHVPPTAASLVLATGALLVIIIVAAVLVKCIVMKLRKKVRPPSAVATNGENDDGSPPRMRRVRLTDQDWPSDTYLPVGDLAPPSYSDTIRADQEQAQHEL